MLSPNPSDRSLEGMDQLKQELCDMYSGRAKWQDCVRMPLKSVHAGVRQAIGNASPEYNTLMGGYQRILGRSPGRDQISGCGRQGQPPPPNCSGSSERQRTPEGQTLISRLGERDPTIPYMLAGSALHDTLAGGVSGAT